MLDTEDNRNNMAGLIEQLMSPGETILFAEAGVQPSITTPAWDPTSR